MSVSENLPAKQEHGDVVVKNIKSEACEQDTMFVEQGFPERALLVPDKMVADLSENV